MKTLQLHMGEGACYSLLVAHWARSKHSCAGLFRATKGTSLRFQRLLSRALIDAVASSLPRLLCTPEAASGVLQPSAQDNTQVTGPGSIVGICQPSSLPHLLALVLDLVHLAPNETLD